LSAIYPGSPGKVPARPQPTKAEAKRPFTDEEVEILFTETAGVKPSSLLRDFMTIAHSP
jgi:hypothetical protein